MRSRGRESRWQGSGGKFGSSVQLRLYGDICQSKNKRLRCEYFSIIAKKKVYILQYADQFYHIPQLFSFLLFADLLRFGTANKQKITGKEDEAEKEISVHNAVKKMLDPVPLCSLAFIT